MPHAASRSWTGGLGVALAERSEVGEEAAAVAVVSLAGVAQFRERLAE